MARYRAKDLASFGGEFRRVLLGPNVGLAQQRNAKSPQDSCQLPVRKGFAAIPELPRWDLV
jgi:hypothetical protein